MARVHKARAHPPLRDGLPPRAPPRCTPARLTTLWVLSRHEHPHPAQFEQGVAAACAAALCGPRSGRTTARRCAPARLGHLLGAHYPSLLCLPAIGISADSGDAADRWLQSVVAPGSMLVLERH